MVDSLHQESQTLFLRTIIVNSLPQIGLDPRILCRSYCGSTYLTRDLFLGQSKSKVFVKKDIFIKGFNTLKNFVKDPHYV